MNSALTSQQNFFPFTNCYGNIAIETFVCTKSAYANTRYAGGCAVGCNNCKHLLLACCCWLRCLLVCCKLLLYIAATGWCIFVWKKEICNFSGFCWRAAFFRLLPSPSTRHLRHTKLLTLFATQYYYSSTIFFSISCTDIGLRSCWCCCCRSTASRCT